SDTDSSRYARSRPLTMSPNTYPYESQLTRIGFLIITPAIDRRNGDRACNKHSVSDSIRENGDEAGQVNKSGPVPVSKLRNQRGGCGIIDHRERPGRGEIEAPSRQRFA